MKFLAVILTVLSLSQLRLPAAEEQATLDQILEELKTLKEKVITIEARIARMENVVAVNASSANPLAPSPRTDPPPAENKEKWYENLRVELRKADVRASGAWVEPESWNKLEPKMTPEEVVSILGDPTRVKFSIRKDTDEIYIYEGDLDGKGNLMKGEVRLYKGKVSRIVPPTF